jgi:hypothetical protein
MISQRLHARNRWLVIELLVNALYTLINRGLRNDLLIFSVVCLVLAICKLPHTPTPLMNV